MARWKLGSAHYLNTTETNQWEYMEEGRRKGPLRKRFDVPRFLDPADSSAWTRTWGPTNDLEGEIIVCLPGRGEPSDIEFLGDPTPEMFPIDDEARAISAKFEDRWRYKTDADITYSQSLIEKFQAEQANAQSKPATVQVEGLADLVAAMAVQSQAIAQLLSTRRA